MHAQEAASILLPLLQLTNLNLNQTANKHIFPAKTSIFVLLAPKGQDSNWITEAMHGSNDDNSPEMVNHEWQ
jgi:hypothetical protein